jgi:tetratricopeptide (TPR) repeat protein
MATIKDVFIGRNRELEQLYQLISERPLLSVHLHGYGGVGKTKLVQTILENYSASKYTVPVYIDFDDIHNRRIEIFEEAIARQHGEKTLQEYRELRKEYRYLQNSGWFERDPDLKARKREKILELLQPPQGKNLLLIFDTFERIEERLDRSDFLGALFKWLAEELAGFDEQTGTARHSVHVIFSGRSFHARAERAAVRARMEQLFGRANFFPLEIEPFSGEEIREYFDSVNEHVLGGSLEKYLKFNEPRIARKVEMLSEGKPIFLGLMATLIVYQKEHWGGNALLEQSFQELNNRKTHYRNEFQKSLLTGLQGLGSDVSYAIQYMSIMKDFPAGNPVLWQKLLSLSESNARALLNNLCSLFFIRENYTLHDELIRLIRQHLWKKMEPLRTYILPLMVEATEELRKSLAGRDARPTGTWDSTQHEEELQTYDFQVMYYKLLGITRKTSPQQEALQRFKELRDRTADITSRRRLLEIVQDKLYWSLLSPEFKAEIDILRNRILNDEGERDSLVAISPALSVDGRIAALCAQAYSQRDENPSAARDTYLQALELATQTNIPARLAEVHNYLGMTYRRLSQYDNAIEHFKESIRLYKELDKPANKAAAENNLAYVYRVKGEYDIGFHYAWRAFATRQELNDQIGLAYSSQTLGELYRDRDELEMAKKYFTDAKRYFASRSLDQDVARVNVDLANLARKQHLSPLVEELLNESIHVFEHLNDRWGLADAHNEFGCELRERGRDLGKAGKNRAAQQVYRQAEQRLLQSIEEAAATHNYYRLADSLSDLALLYMYCFENSGDPSERRAYLIKAQDTAYLAVRKSRRYQMLLPESRALEALGNIYYAQGKYFKAFAQFYLPACLLLAEYQGHGSWRYQQLFDRVQQQLINPAIPEKILTYTAAYMAGRWEAQGKARVAPGFFSILQNIAETGL